MRGIACERTSTSLLVRHLPLHLVPELRLGTQAPETLFRGRMPAGAGGARRDTKRSFADGVPKRSLGTR
jgi:hypothetical protein